MRRFMIAMECINLGKLEEFVDLGDLEEFVYLGDLAELADCEKCRELCDSMDGVTSFSLEAIVSVVKTSSSLSERLGDSDDRVLSSSVGATVSMDRTSSSSSEKLEDSDDKVLSSSVETIVSVDKISSSKARLDSLEMYRVIPGGSLEIDEIVCGESEDGDGVLYRFAIEIPEGVAASKYSKCIPL